MGILLEPAKINRQVADHFLFEEFLCPCCQHIMITDLFYLHVGLLEQIRVNVGSITVNSGYRCPKHNDVVHGAPDSWHMRFATDVRPTNGNPGTLDRMWYLAAKLGFKGRKRYKSFIHLDLRPTEWVEIDKEVVR